MIYIILGTRAQLIKMAPVIQILERNKFSFKLLHTGQHFDSLNEICQDFGIKSPWQSLYEGKEVSSIGQALLWCSSMSFLLISNKFKAFVADEKANNLILVHGDTLSTLLGAALGKRSKIPVAHVESGLRSFNIGNPFPEEITRLITFKLSNIAFCPSKWAENNLINHSHLQTIHTEGNTITDSLKFIYNKETDYPTPAEPYGVISIHRFENIFFKKQFVKILDQIKTISKQYHLVFVLHPATRKQLEKLNLFSILQESPNIEFRPRTGYKNFIQLLSSCTFVISDGGSNQEELAILGKPTYLMRKSTERKDGLNKNIVLGEYSNEILSHFISHLDEFTYSPQKITTNPSQKIVSSLTQYL